MQFVTLHVIVLFVLVCGSASESFSCPIRTPVAVSTTDLRYQTKPNVNGARKFFGGLISDYTGNVENVTSPIIDQSTGNRAIIGVLAQMHKQDSQEALEAAKLAWNNGQGTWPQMSMEERISAILNVVESLKQERENIANVLMWEICKTAEDALQEVDRTILFIQDTIKAYREMDHSTEWTTLSGIYARVRRAAIGIMLCLGPFNYPFNETYATLIPALLAGNVAILKLPTLGGLAHIITMEIYAKHLPPGVMNFVSGSGRVTIGPIMQTGDIDILAFIGGSNAADAIIKDHPRPHRLKVFLQLEGKNVGLVLPDADIKTAAEQILLGSLSYNGQRCTAIKLVMVHKSRADEFMAEYVPKVNALVPGLPWENGVSITPLPEGLKKIEYLQSLIRDAVEKGARVVNAEGGGGDLHGLLMRPAVVYPVTAEMRLYHEEQFGPVVPVAVYSETSELLEYFKHTPQGLQASLFTENASTSAPIVDALSTAVGRINFNTQCGRSPDSLPFSGRRSSALGTMSVSESIRAFSIETVVAGKANDVNIGVMNSLENHSSFMKPLLQQ